MSTQDKMERILKQIHVVLAEGETVPEKPGKVLVDRDEVFSVLEQLNVIVNDMMEEYELTSQAREMAQRRSEKKGEEMIARVTSQADDVYAASLIYTDEALAGIQRLMTDALAASRRIWSQVTENIEKEQRRVREDQMELREQLQDFKDSNKYITMIEECNRKREKLEKEKKTGEQEKKIQNEAKHYSMKGKPEIKVNASYFERRKQAEARQEDSESADTKPTAAAPEVVVNTDSEYFKRKEAAKKKEAEKMDETAGKQEAGEVEEPQELQELEWDENRDESLERTEGQEKKGIFPKEWHLPFGKKSQP